ncbi:MAG: HAD family phosphatase [Burkholderiales bacterium]|nr:HAD family phosphatase [Burkholderiales bacterium]
MKVARKVVVFDLGGVLLDWNPRHLYRKLFADEQAMEQFLARVCTPEWNERQDAGRSFDDAIAALMPQHRDKLHLISAWRDRYPEMIPGALDGTVAIAGELRARGVPLYALTNWSAETFPSQRRRFAFFDWFEGIVVSGEEGTIKPDPRIFHILLDRYGLAANEAVFIDDNPKNAQAASALGIHGIHFQSPAQLRRELVALSLLQE